MQLCYIVVYHQYWPWFGRVVFHSLLIGALAYRCWIINTPVTSVLGLSSLDTTGFCSLSHFPPEIHVCSTAWAMAGLSLRTVPLRFSANLRCQQELTLAARLALQYLLLNLEVLGKGGHKRTVPCCVRSTCFVRLFNSFQFESLQQSFAPEFCTYQLRQSKWISGLFHSGKSPVYFNRWKFHFSSESC